jgi:hypothetical protein
LLKETYQILLIWFVTEQLDFILKFKRDIHFLFVTIDSIVLLIFSNLSLPLSSYVGEVVSYML